MKVEMEEIVLRYVAHVSSRIVLRNNYYRTRNLMAFTILREQQTDAWKKLTISNFQLTIKAQIEIKNL